MKKCYINGIGCVSAQPTFDQEFLEQSIDYSENQPFRFCKPDYKTFIPRAMIRRMSSAVKNSVVAAKLALKDAQVENLEGIITGTGLGCTQDSEKFLERMVKNDEQYLTPTSFIQSTHNTVGGQIALDLNCRAYNVTYVNAGASFPSALLDGLMKIQTQHRPILVGGFDELSGYTTEIYKFASHYKNEKNITDDILNHRTEGCVPGEAASFFVLDNQKNKNTYAEVIDVCFRNKVNDKEEFVKSFLDRNKLSLEVIDVLILGNNGDVNFDGNYDEVALLFSKISPVFYKHLFGEFMASPSVAVWLGTKILKLQYIPKVLKTDNFKETKRLSNILIYNQYRNKDHSLILLKNV